MEVDASVILISPYFWGTAFVLFMIIELKTAGAIAGFMGFGALATAFFIELSLVESSSSAFMTWLIATVVIAAALWGPLKRRATARTTTDAEEGIEPFINDFGTVEGEPLTTAGGVIRLHGARMQAVLSTEAEVEQVEVGGRVKVVKQDDGQRFVVVPGQ